VNDTERELFLYKLTERLTSFESTALLAEEALKILADLFGAAGGICVVRSTFTQPMAFASQINVNISEELQQDWIELSLKKGLSEIDSIKTLSGQKFNEFFGGLLPKDFSTAVLVPLHNGGENFGIAILLGDDEKGEITFNGEEAKFVAERVAIAFKIALRYQEALGLAYIDSLTDLYNSRYLPVILDRRLQDARKNSQPLSLLFLDMDNFREVNNEHGHQAGGKALIEVGWILERHVRAEDTVIRYGGDEYTVVLPAASLESAKEIAERIRAAIHDHIFLRREGHEVHLTASIGVANYPTDADTPEALLHLADQAMYRGKETTRNAVYSAAKNGK